MFLYLLGLIAAPHLLNIQPGSDVDLVRQLADQTGRATAIMAEPRRRWEKCKIQYEDDHQLKLRLESKLGLEVTRTDALGMSSNGYPAQFPRDRPMTSWLNFGVASWHT